MSLNGFWPLKLLVICYIFRTCARWRCFMHIYIVFLIWFWPSFHCLRFYDSLKKINAPKMCHTFRKRLHKLHKTKAKYNQTFMIIEIIDEVRGWWTFIHRRYIKTHFLVQICKNIGIFYPLQRLSNKVIQHPLRTVRHFI